MATLLVNLRAVPDDEADEIRALLTEHEIEFYETQPNWWGFTMGGIWLRDDSQLERARTLLAHYQRDRYLRARSEFRQQQHQGTVPSLLDRLRHDPLRLLALLAIVGVILYFSISPFLRLGGS